MLNHGDYRIKFVWQHHNNSIKNVFYKYLKKIITLFAIEVIKALTSSWVGHDFWHGASAHFKHLVASRKAARSERVVCLMSRKSFSYLFVPQL